MKYGWEIADEVQRFVSNTADIQWIDKARYDKAVNALIKTRSQLIFDEIGRQKTIADIDLVLEELGVTAPKEEHDDRREKQLGET